MARAPGRQHHLIASAAVAVVVGCAGVPRGPDYARLPPGSDVMLRLPAGGETVRWIQDGRVVAFRGLDRRGAPFCRLEGPPEMAGHWRVTGFDVRRASAGRTVAPVLGRPSEPVTLQHYRSRIELVADDDRRARLRCARPGVPPTGRYLRPAEIDDVLGPLGRLTAGGTGEGAR